ncbi:unnamed protein product [Soboliphyme baturini]|uniref:Cysteine and histidine-rich domain-containing protein 1 n=1 Tax=Soboliphyme baturini TaxID=241478 RepID=A0A183ID86_9BILA|nr:unnamed protein product [Soboliphyme baturini]
MSLLQCYHKGCGKKYNPDENSDEACVFHPGEPVFHDIYKKWSCCEKKTTDFTEFLNIRGCTTGQHSCEKPVEPAKPKVADKEQVCSCFQPYAGPQSMDEICQHHSGVPVFHEGMKFWSCCQRKTSDFDNFLQQEGCTKGKHNFIKQKSSTCRYDWFQTGNDVTVNIYAKAVLPLDSCISASSVSLIAIDVSKSIVTMNASKVEIKMKKADLISWPKLFYTESPDI